MQNRATIQQQDLYRQTDRQLFSFRGFTREISDILITESIIEPFTETVFVYPVKSTFYSAAPSKQKKKRHLPKHCLHVDNSFSVGHVIFLGTHRALLVHNHQIIGIYYTTLQQTVQTCRKKEKKTWASDKATDIVSGLEG